MSMHGAAEHQQSAAKQPGRVHVQDLEGDCRNTVVLLLSNADLVGVRREVSQAFGYKQACCLWTRFGAPIEDISLVRDGDTLCSTDGMPFPHQLREVNLPGLDLVAHHSALVEKHYMWGWPRIGQLVGGEAVRTKLAVGWRTSGALASILLLISFYAFAAPPEAVAGGHDKALLRAHFWFSGLALMTAMLSVVLAVLLSMHINLLPRDEDVFWFLSEYGTWLLGWPTALVILSLVCTCGQLVAGAMLNYPALDLDGWFFLGLVAACSAVSSRLFVALSSRCWSRVNAASITKVWPGDPWMDASPA